MNKQEYDKQDKEIIKDFRNVVIFQRALPELLRFELLNFLLVDIFMRKEIYYTKENLQKMEELNKKCQRYLE